MNSIHYTVRTGMKEKNMNREEFVTRYTAFVDQALALAQKARREGLLALEDGLDGEKADGRDIFEYGLRFVVDGTDRDIIAKILGNIIAQEKDEYTRMLKTVQMEAVLGIQAGDNTGILHSVMNSLTDIPLQDDKAYAVLQSGYKPVYPFEDGDDQDGE